MDEAITGSIDRMKEKARRNERQDKDDLLTGYFPLIRNPMNPFILRRLLRRSLWNQREGNLVSGSPSDSIIKKLMIEKGFEIGTIDDFRHIMPYYL